MHTIHTLLSIKVLVIFIHYEIVLITEPNVKEKFSIYFKFYRFAIAVYVLVHAHIHKHQTHKRNR